jgi:hypothetical protein
VALLLAIAGCVPPPPPPAPPSWPTLEPTGGDDGTGHAPLEGPAYNSRVIALRTTLGRAAIRLELRGKARVLRGSNCDAAEGARLQTGCPRCELAGEHDPLDRAALDAITAAFDRYPAGALEETRVERVALCAKLDYEDLAERRTAGTVDLRDRRLLINVSPFFHRQYESAGSFTVEDIVHHELFHLFEHERMRAQYTDDPEWRLHNPPGFEYADPATADDRPHGFVNPYATTNEIEDRASVFQYLMARPDELCEIAKGDPIVRDKVALLRDRIEKLAGAGWLDARAACVDWIQPQPRPLGKRFKGDHDRDDKQLWMTPPWLNPPSR